MKKMLFMLAAAASLAACHNRGEDDMPGDRLAGIERGPHRAGEPLRLAPDHTGAAACQETVQIRKCPAGAEPLDEA